MESPHSLKFESPVESLADSFVSTPGTLYPPLFDKMDSEVMTPKSFDDSLFDNVADSPAPEKKPVKKRKSWGQQLPEPKTNLPPRKRAKTEDEKEQRRVERVLRNRRAAQSSRERKRQEVEALEARMKEKERFNEDMQRKYRDLELQLADAQAKNLELQQQLELATGGNMTAFRGSAASSPAHTEQFRAAPSPVTFSQELFSSRDSPERASYSPSHSTSTPQTVNPASLSPEIRPVAELSNASSSDMTQHPAAMLCYADLQCQSEEQRPWTPLALSHILAIMTLITTITAVSSTLLASMAQIIKSLQTKSSLSPTASILTTIIWLTTTPVSLMTPLSRNSSTTTKTTNPRLKLSLRIRLLNHLLACNPNLARPLMDATMEEMRLVSEQRLSHGCLSGAGSSDRLGGGNSSSIESLMTLLWATHCFEKKWGDAAKLDGTTDESRQERGELAGMDGLFSSSITTTATALNSEPSKKSLGGWRLA